MPNDEVQVADAKQNSLTRVPIEIKVCVGKSFPPVKELLKLTRNSVLQLNKQVSDPVELYVGEKLIALGELEELDGEAQGQLAVRLTRVIELEEGI